MKIKSASINALAILISTCISLIIGEWIIRIFLDPMDFLSLELVEDDILGHKIPPFSGGLDSWGFRNRTVPDSASIVTIGDSYTYGNNARQNENWPSYLMKKSKKSVYNLGVPAYGPHQYYYLLKNKGLKLKPKLVICGFYLGNDLLDAFKVTYGLDYWSSLRNQETKFKKIKYISVVDETKGTSWHKKIRKWLSSKSILYRITVHGPILGPIKRKMQTLYSKAEDENYVILNIKEKNILQRFMIKFKKKYLDPERAETKEGLRIALILLKKMKNVCDTEDIKFLVLIIPSKESVYSDYFKFCPNSDHRETVYKIIENEKKVNNQIIEFFKKENISFVTTLDSLRERVGKEKLYPSGFDDHPNRNGYQCIADCINRYVENLDVN